MRPIILLAIFLALPRTANAQGFIPEATAPTDSVPNGMNYQGRLEKDGFPVTGTKTMVFRLYDAPVGGGPTGLWSSGEQQVAVTQGIFATTLDIPFTALGGSLQKYLEIEVDATILSPRDPIRSVPYAKIAESVEGSINVSSAGLTFTTAVGSALAISSGSGRVGVGTALPLARLHVSSGSLETGVILLVSTGASTLMSVDGNGVVTANSFVGDGTNVGNVVRKTGDGMSGPLTLSGSTLTVTGAAFSVGGSTLVAALGNVGVRTATPQTTLEVNGSAQFGQDAIKSTFSAAGALALNTNASLSVGTTFFVNNGRVGINTLSPATTFQILGDVYIGDPAVHDLSAESDLLVKGNIIVDGLFIQHGGGTGVFDRVGVGIASPLSKLSVVGDSAFSAGATFGTTVTVLGVFSAGGNVGIGTVSPLTNLHVVGNTSVTGNSTFGSSMTVRAASAFGSGASTTTISAAGGLMIASGQNITVAGGAQLLGLPAAPGVTGAASKEYVDTQLVSGGGPWTRTSPVVYLTTPGDNVVMQTSLTVQGTAFSVGGNQLAAIAGGNVGIGTASPLSKFSVAGNASFSGVGTFASSLTVRDAAAFGTTGQAAFSNTGVLTLATPLATGQGGTGNINGTVAALTTNPTDCGANQFANTIAANGNLTCAGIVDADVPDTITVNQAAALTTNPTDCGANQFADAIAANGNLTCAAIVDADVPDTITVNLAAAATALNANPTDCAANQFADTIAANGNLTCAAIVDADVPDTITVNQAAALTTNPTDCGANQFANTIAANGNLTCAAISDADVPDTITVNAANIAPNGGLRLFNKTFAQLMTITPTALGEVYYCSDCIAQGIIALSTGTAAAGQFATAIGASLR